MPGFPRRLLLAADGSTESDVAREAVVDLVTGGPERRVHVLHVVLLSPWTNPTTLSPDQLARLREQGRDVLDRQVTALRAAGVEPAGTHLALGRTVDEVLRLRDVVDADLVVLGSRGLNAFSRILLGSDAESVVRHAPCSVLVVRSRRRA